MLQIIDLENHELLTEISAKESATISGGVNKSGISITSLILPLLFVLILLPSLGSLNNPM